MNFVIIDLEFNSMRDIGKNLISNESFAPKMNFDCPNEIIQIGAVKLDKYFKVIDEFKTYVKPVIYDVVSPAITEITGITDEELKDGLSFKDALELLEVLVDDDSIICSWAKDDPIELIRNAGYHGLKINCLKQYVDIQEYCTKVLVQKKSLGLKTAMKKLNVAYSEECLHDALNDCLYTIEVLKRVFNFKALQSYIINDIVNIPLIMLRGKKEEAPVAV